jgi:hypothetical protein
MLPKHKEFVSLMIALGARPIEVGPNCNPTFKLGPIIEIQVTSNQAQAESEVFGLHVCLRNDSHYLPLGNVSTSQGGYEAILQAKKVLETNGLTWMGK